MSPLATGAEAVEDLEIDLLLEGVLRRFGHDFRGYRRESVRLRLRALMAQRRLHSVSALQDDVLHDPAAGAALLRALGAPGAALFDDPDYFRALRGVLVPWLGSCPAPRVWIAECVCAEQVCALAILLIEEGLYGKTQIFATASNEALLQEAREGRFALERLAQYADNYRKCGGRADLAAYIDKTGDKTGSQAGEGVFSAELRANITWAQYSLATDASFNEFQLIMCRQAMADFDKPLRRRVLQLFDDSMPLFGILSVDHGEELNSAPFVARYRNVAERSDLYRRVG